MKISDNKKVQIRKALDANSWLYDDAIGKLEKNFNYLRTETRDVLKLESSDGNYSKDSLIKIAHVAKALSTTVEALAYFADKASKELK